MASKMMASSATSGFFQAPPVLTNQYHDDYVLRGIIDSYYGDGMPIADVRDELSAYGKRVIQPDIFALVADAERNPPSLSTHSTFGVPRTILHTSHGWRELQNMGIAAGIVAIPYADPDAGYPNPTRTHQFLKYHLWSGSAAMVICPSAMTDGAATLLRRHLNDRSLDTQQREVFTTAYKHLTSFNPGEAWTSGQWMTERSGGSDVQGTETVATYCNTSTDSDVDGTSLGPWKIEGFKWFSSATDSQMTVLLAKTDKGGLSAFYAPMRKRLSDRSTVMNGVNIQRLKPKLGTRALPTAELVLQDMRGWLIGKEGDGVREISAILNITRLHNAIGALGHWGRALAITRAYARVRKVEDRLLQDNAAFIRNLARNTLSYAAHMQLGFFVVSLLDQVEAAETGRPRRPTSSVDRDGDAESASALLRLLTPVAKAQCSKMAIFGVQECMESLGGIGYIEDEQEFNIARLFRDCNVLSIWEGTTDVMASDVVRVLKGRSGSASLEALRRWIQSAGRAWADAQWEPARISLDAAQTRLEEMVSIDAAGLRVQGRELLGLLAWLTSAVLLLQAAANSKTDLSTTLAEQWIGQRPHEPIVVRTTFSQDRDMAFGAPAHRVSKI